MADPAGRLTMLADELRALASNGLHFTDNPYDQARYDRLLGIAAELLAVGDSRGAAEIERTYRGALGIRTPLVSADTAVFDSGGRLLLVQRADSGQWCMPGGAADVGEPPSAAAEREVWEETGLRVRARELIGLYDNRLLPEPHAVHVYHLVFAGERVDGELTSTHETSAAGWFTESDTRALALYKGHVVKVPDAFRWYRGELTAPVFH